MDRRLEDWCDQVIAEVRSWVDHNAIRAELEAHIEDRCAALEELNYPLGLAAERTLAAMGDPVEVGKALDKEHSLWLGRLWIALIAESLGYAAAMAWGYRTLEGVSGDVAGFALAVAECVALTALAVL